MSIRSRMPRASTRSISRSLKHHAALSTHSQSPPLISIINSTFYRHHPSSLITTASGEKLPNPPLFPALDFKLPSFSSPAQHWSVLSSSSSSRTAFLQILRGNYLAFPPAGRSYPYLATPEIAEKDLRLRAPSHAIQYVGFDAERGGLGGTSTQGAYLAARYESRREETDYSLLDYLRGNTELNASEDESLIKSPNASLLDKVVEYLKLEKLAGMPVSNLSNGQTRRARIARALLGQPECLVLDGPFMGLDPPTVKHLSSLLYRLAEARTPRLILSLKSDDMIPDWITHLALLDNDFTVYSQGPKEEVLRTVAEEYRKILHTSKGQLRRRQKEGSEAVRSSIREIGRHLDAKGYLPQLTNKVPESKTWGEMPPEERSLSVDGFPEVEGMRQPRGEPIVEMSGVQIRYGDRCVLGDWNFQPMSNNTQKTATTPGLFWTVHAGERWGIFGANGSGKTTLLAILTSDHPQSYSQPLKMFGRSRLPTPGIPGLSLWDIHARLGHSSPEVHAFFPKSLSVRRALESAWADTPLSRPKLTHEIDQKVDAALRWFQAELMPSLGPTQLQKDEMRRFEAGGDPWQKPTVLPLLRTAHEDYDIYVGTGLEWADDTRFGEVGFSAQRVILFLRAVIRNPPLVVLDEAFSGMDDAARDRCLLFLSHGEKLIHRLFDASATHPKNGLGAAPAAAGHVIAESDISRLGRVRVKGLQPEQALLVVSHNPAEVPGCVREWICLPEAGQGTVRFGVLDGPVAMRDERWKEIWAV